MRRFLLLLPLVLALVSPAAPALAQTSACPTTPIQVVAVENQYGSIVQQLGGDCVVVTNIITDPNADPHDYQPTAQDSRTYQSAQLVVENGLGYDDFSDRIIGTVSPPPAVVNAGAIVGLTPGANPHVWYSPTYVDSIAQAITQQLQQIAPSASDYFQQRAQSFSAAEGPYHQEISKIGQTYSGTWVGSTESIFVYMAQATGLTLISPAKFMDDIAEGNDPSAQDVATFQNQITQHQLRVLVFNVQTITNITDGLKELAVTNNIPLVAVAETMPPGAGTFQDWQLSQLQSLEQALSAGHG